MTGKLHSLLQQKTLHYFSIGERERIRGLEKGKPNRINSKRHGEEVEGLSCDGLGWGGADPAH